ncbi:MAG: SPOR domain-containing protein, partial [Pseudoxanthomonas sp.]
YAAAIKLGITQRGTGRVEVRALNGDDAGSTLAAAVPAPVKTTVATGVATRIATGKPTAMDQLVGQLPKQPQAAEGVPNNAASNTAASNTVAAASATSDPWRYHVNADPEAKPSTQGFDAWMNSRGVRVATGKPTAVHGTVVAPLGTKRDTAPARPAVVAAVATLPSTPAAASAKDVRLQVASFASRENADRELARLSAAGIARASLSDVATQGRTLWRLRVEAPDQASATELAGRIAGLGFGQPQVVRE